MSVSQSEKAARFCALHDGPGAFVIPNPWDAGSARILAGLGFQALATSSAASASALGRRDHRLNRDEALAQARLIGSQRTLRLRSGQAATRRRASLAQGRLRRATRPDPSLRGERLFRMTIKLHHYRICSG
jgi:hypothetical protein